MRETTEHPLQTPPQPPQPLSPAGQPSLNPQLQNRSCADQAPPLQAFHQVPPQPAAPHHGHLPIQASVPTQQAQHGPPSAGPLPTASSVVAAAPPAHADALERFLGRSINTAQLQARKKEFSSEQGIDALRALAARGAWKRMGTLAGQLLAASHPVDALLRLRMHRIIAMLKMKEVPQAARELGLLGDLTGHGWYFERYPTMYPTRRGSMVPFTLLLLHALMPSYAGDHAQSLQRMYDLLELLRRGSWPRLTVEASATAGTEQAAAAADGAGADADADAAADMQRRQRAAVLLALVNVYCAAQEFPLAILHLEQMIATEGERADAPHAQLSLLHSLLGRIHIQARLLRTRRSKRSRALTCTRQARAVAGAPPSFTSQGVAVGNLEAAEDVFNKLECLLPDADGSADGRAPVILHILWVKGMLFSLNRGYLAMASGEYEVALAELDAALALSPRCAVAANNRAVCLLYCCRLADAIASLESFLKHDPERNTQQALLSNLAVLYQMLSGGAAAKQTLEKLALTFGPDDLECSALLLNAA